MVEVPLFTKQERALLLFIKFAALTEINPMHSLAVRPIYTIASGEFRGFIRDPQTTLRHSRPDLFDVLLAASHSISVGSMDTDKCWLRRKSMLWWPQSD